MTGHQRENYWRINGIPNNITELPVDGHPGPESTRTHGESYDFRVRLTSESDSETGRWPGYVDRYQELLATYGPHAGMFSLHQLVDGSVAFTETHSGTSLLVSLLPPSDASASRGGYYLVSSVEDETTLPDAVCLLSMEMTYLASLAEYQDVQRAKRFLEAETV